MSSILIKNGTVVTLGETNRVLEGHGVLINNDRISAIDEREHLDDETADQVIDAAGKIVMPAFINTHMHFYSTFARGLSRVQPSGSFREVLENLWWRLDKQLTLEDCYYSALLACIDGIKHGTTTFVDHHASPFAVRGSLSRIGDAVKAAGLRASLCYELSDRDGPKIAEEGIQENLHFIAECGADPSNQLSALFGMHASFTLSDKTMERAVALAEEAGAGFHIHTAEARYDQEKCLQDHGISVVARLMRHGVLGTKTICAHCTNIDEQEMDLLARTGTMVVHNPQSNMNNAVGVAEVLRMGEKGILVGLGTDAMTTNMTEELRSALWIHKLANNNPSVGFTECLHMLLQGNPAIVGRLWEKDLGELAPGKKADVILLDYRPPTRFDAETFLGHMAFGLSQCAVDTTISNGKILMEDRKLVGMDEEAVAAKARELSDRVWKRF